MNLGGTIISDPAAVARGNVVDVYARGPDSSIRRRVWNGTAWQPFSNLAGRTGTKPAAGMQFLGQTKVFVTRLGNLEPFFRYSY